jgi:hypothetical protein
MALELASLESASDCAKSAASSIFLHLEMAELRVSLLVTNTIPKFCCRAALNNFCAHRPSGAPLTRRSVVLLNRGLRLMAQEG